MKKQILLTSLVVMALVASCGKATKTTNTNPTASAPVGNVCFEKSEVSYNDTSTGAAPSVTIIIKNTGTATAKNILCKAYFKKMTDTINTHEAVIVLDKTTVETTEPNNTLKLTITFKSEDSISTHADYKNLDVTLQWEESYDNILSVKNAQAKTITIK